MTSAGRAAGRRALGRTTGRRLPGHPGRRVVRPARSCSPTSPRPSPPQGVAIVSATVEPPSEQRVRHTYTLQLPDAARLPGPDAGHARRAGRVRREPRPSTAARRPPGLTRTAARLARRPGAPHGCPVRVARRAPPRAARRALVAGGPCRSPPAPRCAPPCSPPPSRQPSSPPAPARARSRSASATALFPHLGNPGYDVASYDIALTYPGSNTKPLDAVTTIDARDHRPRSTGSTSTSPTAPSARSRSTARPPRSPARARTWSSRPAQPLARGQPAADHRPAHQRPAAARPRRRLGPHRATGSRWPTRPTPRTGSSRATTTPPTRRYFTFRVTAPERATRPSPTACPPAQDRDGGATTWTYRTRAPHGHRAGPGLHRPLHRRCTAPARTGCPCATWCPPRTARSWSRG